MNWFGDAKALGGVSITLLEFHLVQLSRLLLLFRKGDLS